MALLLSEYYPPKLLIKLKFALGEVWSNSTNDQAKGLGLVGKSPGCQLHSAEQSETSRAGTESDICQSSAKVQASSEAVFWTELLNEPKSVRVLLLLFLGLVL